MIHYLRIQPIGDYLPGGIPVFINDDRVPFLCYYVLVVLVDLDKQLLFAAGKESRSCLFGPFIHGSTLKVLEWLFISLAHVIHDNVSLV